MTPYPGGRPGGSDMRLSEIEHEVMSMKAQYAMSQQDMTTRMMQSGGPGSMAMSTTSFMQPGPSTEHKELMQSNAQLLGMYNKLMKDHIDLLNTHKTHQEAHMAISNKKATAGSGGGGGGRLGMAGACSLGVVRLDYDYPPAPGDIDSPESYAYDVFYRVVPGLTFAMCQSGKMTDEVENNFVDAVKYLVSKGVTGITGDCGFMMYFQQLARRNCNLPVFMSSLAQLPAVTCAFNQHELIAILTANSETLKPMRNLIKDECGVDPDERRFIIVGAQDVPGFEAVAAGGKVNVEKVTPGMVELCHQTLKQFPKVRGFLLECTELPPYADAIRASTRLPVWDSITGCDYFISGAQDNARFGLNNWQAAWDGKQDDYSYGSNLTAAQKAALVNKC